MASVIHRLRGYRLIGYGLLFSLFETKLKYTDHEYPVGSRTIRKSHWTKLTIYEA